MTNYLVTMTPVTVCAVSDSKWTFCNQSCGVFLACIVSAIIRATHLPKAFAMAMLSNRPMRGITAIPPPKPCTKHREEYWRVSCALWTQERLWKWKRHLAQGSRAPILLLALPSASYLYDLSKRDNSSIGRGVCGGWRTEWRKSLGSFPSYCKHMMTKSLPGKCYEGCSHNHQGITHWSKQKRNTKKCKQTADTHTETHSSLTTTQVLTGSNTPH